MTLDNGRKVNPIAVLVVLALGTFMTLLDLTIVNVAIPSMLDGLHATLDYPNKLPEAVKGIPVGRKAGGFTFQISYQGGTNNNDVVLTVIDSTNATLEGTPGADSFNLTADASGNFVFLAWADAADADIHARVFFTQPGNSATCPASRPRVIDFSCGL